MTPLDPGPENRGQVSCEVSVQDVHLAVREITEQAHLLAVKDSAPQERLLLVAITNEVHLGGKVRHGRASRVARLSHFSRGGPTELPTVCRPSSSYLGQRFLLFCT